MKLLTVGVCFFALIFAVHGSAQKSRRAWQVGTVTDSEQEASAGTIRTSPGVNWPIRGRTRYTLETNEMTYVVATMDKLSIVVGRKIEFAIDGTTAYLYSDGKERKLEILKRSLKCA